MLLADTLNKSFRGKWWVEDYTLFQNGKKILVIDPDKDSVETIIKQLKDKKIK